MERGLAQEDKRECHRRREPSIGTKVQLAIEKILPLMHFSLACRDGSCILHLRTRFTAARERGSFRRTRVRIEFVIASSAIPFPGNPNNQKKSCKTDALASCCGHFLH